MKPNDWYKKLQELKTSQKPELPIAQNVKPDKLLGQVEALRLLKDVNRFLLDGVGRIELFEDASGYDLVMALMWNGSISEPAKPRANSKHRHHIFIGVRDECLYVNGKRIKPGTSNLQRALLSAAESPGLRKDIT